MSPLSTSCCYPPIGATAASAPSAASSPESPRVFVFFKGGEVGDAAPSESLSATTPISFRQSWAMACDIKAQNCARVQSG
jgi:hypothetical protein